MTKIVNNKMFKNQSFTLRFLKILMRIANKKNIKIQNSVLRLLKFMIRIANKKKKKNLTHQLQSHLIKTANK